MDILEAVATQLATNTKKSLNSKADEVWPNSRFEVATHNQRIIVLFKPDLEDDLYPICQYNIEQNRYEIPRRYFSIGAEEFVINQTLKYVIFTISNELRKMSRLQEEQDKFNKEVKDYYLDENENAELGKRED